jgi:hypothetical protein
MKPECLAERNNDSILQLVYFLLVTSARIQAGLLGSLECQELGA